MSDIAIRIAWDKYEVALLLKYTIAVEEEGVSRASAVSEVSEILRNRAVSNGLAIDEFFRNINGISMQMAALRNCYLGVEKGLTISKLFREIVSLYKSDQSAFERILQEEAVEMENSKGKANQTADESNFVNFAETRSYAHTKPTSCTYKGTPIACAGWNALYINLVRAFYKDYALSFPVGKQLSSSARIDIGNSKGMIYPKEIADGIYLECNVSATGVINKIRALMNACNISPDDVVIYYCRSGQKADAADKKDAIAKEKAPAWSPKYTKELSDLHAVVRDILRVIGNSSVVFFDELEQQLQYIPSDKIAWSLSASPEFVWISEGKYFVMQHFLVGNEDETAILDFVARECERNGFASITDLPFGSIPDDNYELSVTALYAAVFTRILKGRYYLHGKIITKESDGVDITALLKAFCVGRDECTVTEVLARATELTGAVNKQHSMEALYETMVRIDVDRFVSERQISFDVERIDHLLSEVFGDRFAPIKSITTFALFPACGISWNHYVLESFCYRFSNKYRLVVMNYNDKNAGIIKLKDLPLGYTDMLCEAAAASNIELTQDRVGQYFFDCGLTAKRKYSNLPEIVERARNIREER